VVVPQCEKMVGGKEKMILRTGQWSTKLKYWGGGGGEALIILSKRAGSPLSGGGSGHISAVIGEGLDEREIEREKGGVDSKNTLYRRNEPINHSLTPFLEKPLAATKRKKEGNSSRKKGKGKNKAGDRGVKHTTGKKKGKKLIAFLHNPPSCQREAARGKTTNLFATRRGKT